MIANLVPKEFMLETPKNYDSVRTEAMVWACSDLSSRNVCFRDQIKRNMWLIFDVEDDRKMAHNIFEYITDTNPALSINELIHTYIISLNESGFFG